MFKNLFKNNDNNSLVGVDLGLATIKIVELKNDNKKPTLVTYGISSGDRKNKKEINHNISPDIIYLMQQARTTTNKVVGALPTSSVFSTIVDFPKMPTKETDPTTLTLEECQELLAKAPERKGRGGKKKKAGKKAEPKEKKLTPKQEEAKKKREEKAAEKKAEKARVRRNKLAKVRRAKIAKEKAKEKAKVQKAEAAAKKKEADAKRKAKK